MAEVKDPRQDLDILYRAIRNRSTDAIKSILDNQENAAHLLNYQYTQVSPIAFAAELGDCEILQLLLDYGADINFGGKRCQLPLYTAAKRNHLDFVKVCVKAGAVIDRQYVNGNTPMLEAAKCGHTEMVIELLKSGSNPHSVNNGGDSGLHMAAFDGNLPLVKVFLEAGLSADLQQIEVRHRNIPTGVRPLHMACLGDNHEVAQVLIENGASVNALKKSGRAPLHAAAGKNSLKIAALLLKHGCEVDIMDENHKTPLTSAIDAVHLHMVELLISAGADVDTRDKWGTPALINAAYHDRLDIMLALIKGGCDVNAATNNGITPMGASIRQPFRALMATLLTKAGSMASAQDLEKVFTDPDIENYDMLLAPSSLQDSCRYSIVSHFRHITAANSHNTEGDSDCKMDLRHQQSPPTKNFYMNALSQLELPPKLRSYLKFDDLSHLLPCS